MPAQLLKKLFTVEDYHRMGETGIFTEDDRVELIEGEIIQMAAIGTRHAGCVNRLNRLFCRLPEERAIVAIQNPIQLTQQTEPQPDLVLLQPRDDYYSTAHPTPNEVLLLIEVADSSVDYDRDVKVMIYARSLIQEVWLVDLVAECLEVYRQPTPNGYSLMQRIWRNQEVSPLAFSELIVSADFVFG